MNRLYCLAILFASIFKLSTLASDVNVIETVEVNNNGEVGETIKDDKPITEDGECNTNNVDYISQLNSLQSQFTDLTKIIQDQQSTIESLNETLNEYVIYNKDSAYFQNINEQSFFGLVSSNTYENHPFIMLEVMSVRLPSRDAMPLKKQKQHGRLIKRRKSRYVHIIITLTRNGIFNIWDEFQNKLFEFYDESLDELNNKNEYVIYSDIQNNPVKEGTWLVMSRKGESWLRVYGLSTWRHVSKATSKDTVQYIDYDSRYLDAQLTLETVIYPPKTVEKATQTNDDESKEAQATTPPLPPSRDNATVTSVTAYQHSKRKSIVVSYDDGMIYSYKVNGIKSGSFKSPNQTIVSLSQTNKKLELMFATEYGFRFLKLPKLSKLGRFCKYPDDFGIVNSVRMDRAYPFILFLTSTTGKIAIYNTKRMTKKLCEPLDVFSIHPYSPLEIDSTKGHLLVTSIDGLHIYNTSFALKYQKPFLSLMRRFDEDFDNFLNKESLSPVLIGSWSDTNGKTIVVYAESGQAGRSGENESFRMVVLDSNLPVFDEKDGTSTGWSSIISKAPLLIAIGGFVLFFGYFKKQASGPTSGGFASRSPLGKLTSALTGGGPKRGDRRLPRGAGSNPLRQSVGFDSSSVRGGAGGAGGGGGGGGPTMAGRKMAADQMMDRWKSRHPNMRTARHATGRGYVSDSD